MTAPIANKPRLITGRMVLIGMVAFFGVVAAVNGVFIYLSLSTFPGVETDGAYRKGLTYNQSLAEAESWRALGWRIDLAWRNQGPDRGRFTLKLTGSDGAGLVGQEVALILRRPVHAEADRNLRLGEGKAGVYGSKIISMAPGNWDAMVRITRPGKADFMHRQRIIVP